jgi:hypothetical protein
MNLASHATPSPKGNVELLVKRNEANSFDHKHKFVVQNSNDNNNDHATAAAAHNENKSTTIFKRRRIVDIATVTDVEQAKKLLSLGWEYKTSYPATISNIPHYILVKRE